MRSDRSDFWAQSAKITPTSQNPLTPLIPISALNLNDAEQFRKEYQTLRRDQILRETFIRNAKQKALNYSEETIDPMILELYDELKPKYND